MAPSFTDQKFLSPSQPFKVAPSNKETNPLWSLKSIGSAPRNPKPRAAGGAPGAWPAGGLTAGALDPCRAANRVDDTHESGKPTSAIAQISKNLLPRLLLDAAIYPPAGAR